MEILDNIGFDWQVALANLVSFLIIFWILKKYAFGPVGNIIDKRNEEIAQGLQKAEDAVALKEQAQEEAQATVKDAHKEAQAIIEQSRVTAQSLRTQAEEKAQEEASQIKAQAYAKIEDEKKQAERDLFEKTAGLVTLGVQKVLEEEVDEAKDKEITKKALAFLQSHK